MRNGSSKLGGGAAYFELKIGKNAKYNLGLHWGKLAQKLV